MNPYIEPQVYLAPIKKYITIHHRGRWIILRANNLPKFVFIYLSFVYLVLDSTNWKNCDSSGKMKLAHAWSLLDHLPFYHP